MTFGMDCTLFRCGIDLCLSSLWYCRTFLFAGIKVFVSLAILIDSSEWERERSTLAELGEDQLGEDSS